MEGKDERKRATNFSCKEETVLIETVKKYKDHIECRKSDTNTNSIKARAWVAVEKEFNNTCGEVFRTAKVLRNKYENIKKRTKQRFAEEKKYLLGTGGGPEHVVGINSIDLTVKEIIGSQVTGFTSEFGGDALDNEKSTPVDRVTEIGFEDMDSVLSEGASFANGQNQDFGKDEDPKEPVASHSDWSKYTPDMLRTPKSVPLKTTPGKISERISGNILSKKMLGWAESKIELTELQKQCFKEEHELKKKLMIAEHEERIRLMQKESEARIAKIMQE